MQWWSSFRCSPAGVLRQMGPKVFNLKLVVAPVGHILPITCCLGEVGAALCQPHVGGRAQLGRICCQSHVVGWWLLWPPLSNLMLVVGASWGVNFVALRLVIRGSPGPRFVHLIVCRWVVWGPHVVNLMLLVAGSYGPQFAKLILAALGGWQGLPRVVLQYFHARAFEWWTWLGTCF